MELTWTDVMSVGNAKIDSDHKILFCMVNGAVQAIENGDCLALSQAFKLLDWKLRVHFAYEEHIAQSTRFPFAQHKLAQQYLLGELKFLKDELLARGCVWCGDAVKHYSHSLGGLLVNHIVGKDMLMKPALQSYPYNFNPVGS